MSQRRLTADLKQTPPFAHDPFDGPPCPMATRRPVGEQRETFFDASVFDGQESDRMLQETELVNVDGFALNSGVRVWWRFEVDRGHRIKGIVTGSDNFEFALLDEIQFARWHRGDSTDALEGGASKSSYAFDRVARSRDTWYVGLSTQAWFSPFNVSVRVRRLPD